jgi:two-component system, NtrC family, response regulator HydG
MRREDATTLKYARASELTMRFRLFVLEGADAGRAIEVPVDAPRILVGTSRACAIALSDPHVSRRHLSLGAASARLELVDLGSSNGTRVNGVRVSECALEGGEIVTLGSTVLRIEPIGTTQVEDAYPDALFVRAVGTGRVMQSVFAACHRIAGSPLPLLLEGETGTGKELLAECIHEIGPRREAPFVVFDPSLTPEHLLPAVLFGCEAGALPGPFGEQRRSGLFERAHGGTLLIDGPADLPLDIQRKLVRAVERGEIQRVGSDVVERFDVRIIAISQTDLDRAVEEGRLREDLFYRLLATRIEAPPLRKRREDIGPLAAHFWTSLGGRGSVPPALLARYESHSWPGNVRELQNAVAQHLATGFVGADPEPERGSVRPPAPTDDFGSVLELDLPLPRAKQRILAAFEAAFVARLLTKHGGNVSKAAAASGVAHRYFQILHARHRK